MGLGTRSMLHLLLRGQALSIAATAVIQPYQHLIKYLSSESQQHLPEDALYSLGAPLTAYQGVIAAVLGQDKGR